LHYLSVFDAGVEIGNVQKPISSEAGSREAKQLIAELSIDGLERAGSSACGVRMLVLYRAGAMKLLAFLAAAAWAGIVARDCHDHVSDERTWPSEGCTTRTELSLRTSEGFVPNSVANVRSSAMENSPGLRQRGRRRVSAPRRIRSDYRGHRPTPSVLPQQRFAVSWFNSECSFFSITST